LFKFIICGGTGLLLLKHRTQYSVRASVKMNICIIHDQLSLILKHSFKILCFASITSITIITAVVNLQLLRLGLVNHTTIGRTFQKESKDVYIIIGIIVDACEILVCTISLIICLKLNYDAKNNRFKSHRKEGVFFVQIISDKDIVVVQSASKTRNKRNRSHKKSRITKKKMKQNLSKSLIASKSTSFDNKFLGDPV
jgi:hypothetical protein